MQTLYLIFSTIFLLLVMLLKRIGSLVWKYSGGKSKRKDLSEFAYQVRGRCCVWVLLCLPVFVHVLIA